MTGAFTFKKFDPAADQDHWDCPAGHWVSWLGARDGVPYRAVMIRCPLCDTCGMLPHRVDPAGGVHPSIVCTGPDRAPGTCPFHTMPNTLEGWTHGDRPDTKDGR